MAVAGSGLTQEAAMKQPYVAVIGLSIFAVLSGRPSGQMANNTAGLQRARLTITGSVVDAALSPVSGATVTLEHAGRLEKKTTTDAEGKFRFVDVAPGSYRVRAEHKDFPPVSRDLQVPSRERTIQLPIVLIRPEDVTKATAEKSEFGAGRG